MNQLSHPAQGDTVAIMHTGMGDIKIRLFPDKTPKTFENFTTHAKNGYYDGLTFHRVIKDFMIQGGDPSGNGTGGQSIWNEPFEDEPDIELRNYNGALSMANAGPGTNGSQFFIVQASTCPEQILHQMPSLADKGFPNEVADNYAKVGGTPWLDFRHTVFGQVYDGMDVVNAIASVDADRNDKPVSSVVINSIEITEYR
ncbi:MAG: peptidylprolyl isomerase [Oscillospiraceae bacterium]|nr:peptidylprolyl isomerase [Oscillospiraceae bacterium]MDD3833099.1 peptidylprolyl isomerase [Oscillospiraceae bacterium]MDD4545881.1 peptidylprolyl isomerase [Oscillospiraceae bacterium]